MRNSTTIDKEFFKWPVCLMLSLVITMIFGLLFGCEQAGHTPEQEVTYVPGEYLIEASDYVLSGDPAQGYYIKFNSEYSPSIGSENMQTADIQFDSMQAFADAVIKGNLSDAQKAKVYTVFARDEQGTITCDFQNLQSAVLPDGMHQDGVSWTGAIYTQSFSSDQNGSGNVVVCTQDIYQERYRRDYVNSLEASGITVTKQEKIAERDATEIYYKTRLAEMKCIRYELVAGNKTYVVDEQYILSAAYMDEDWISDRIPYRIHMYCTDGVSYYIVDLFHPESRPSEEWLLSFGLTKYTDDSAKE